MLRTVCGWRIWHNVRLPKEEKLVRLVAQMLDVQPKTRVAGRSELDDLFAAVERHSDIEIRAQILAPLPQRAICAE